METSSCNAALFLIVTLLPGPPTNPPEPLSSTVETVPIAIHFLIVTTSLLLTEPIKPPARELPLPVISALTTQFSIVRGAPWAF